MEFGAALRVVWAFKPRSGVRITRNGIYHVASIVAGSSSTPSMSSYGRGRWDGSEFEILPLISHKNGLDYRFNAWLHWVLHLSMWGRIVFGLGCGRNSCNVLGVFMYVYWLRVYGVAQCIAWTGLSAYDQAEDWGDGVVGWLYPLSSGLFFFYICQGLSMGIRSVVLL